MVNARDRLPQPGERWYAHGQAGERVIISELYYLQVNCPYHNRPNVRFINEVTGQVGTMPLRAFLTVYMDKVAASEPGIPNGETNGRTRDNATPRNKALSDPFERWKEADSRRFSHD